MDNAEDVVKYLLAQIRREGELQKALLEHAFMGNELKVGQFIRSLEGDEERESYQNALTKLGKSQLLKKRDCLLK